MQGMGVLCQYRAPRPLAQPARIRAARRLAGTTWREARGGDGGGAARRGGGFSPEEIGRSLRVRLRGGRGGADARKRRARAGPHRRSSGRRVLGSAPIGAGRNRGLVDARRPGAIDRRGTRGDVRGGAAVLRTGPFRFRFRFRLGKSREVSGDPRPRGGDPSAPRVRPRDGARGGRPPRGRTPRRVRRDPRRVRRRARATVRRRAGCLADRRGGFRAGAPARRGARGGPRVVKRGVLRARAVRLRVRRARVPAARLRRLRAVPRGSVYVLGDCADVSVDSRVWGPLRTSEIRARPLNTLKGRR